MLTAVDTVDNLLNPCRRMAPEGFSGVDSRRKLCKLTPESSGTGSRAPHSAPKVVHSDTRTIPSYPQEIVQVGITTGPRAPLHYFEPCLIRVVSSVTWL